jgi:predicted RNA-binding Zn-ribbon protein involved in translation (DUF1610 family)
MQEHKCELCKKEFPRNELVTFFSEGDCGDSQMLYCRECSEVILAFIASEAEEEVTL